ncbi:MAG: hypothetical protein ACJA0N_001173 [Pseudohongiellaceae bacterium]|jgi:hypothetical protein
MQYFHIVLHGLVPLLVAFVFFRQQWQKAFLIMLATILVDIDHLLATPIYSPERCSIGFHPLHQYPAIIVYALIYAYKPLRLVSLGLIIHMVLDGLDCL